MRICRAEKNCMASPVKMQMTKILGGTLPLGMPGGAKIVGGPLCRAAKPRIEAGGRRRLLQDARRSPAVVRLQDNQLRQPKTSTTTDGKSIASLYVGSQCSWTDEILNTFLPLFLDRPGAFWHPKGFLLHHAHLTPTLFGRIRLPAALHPKTNEPVAIQSYPFRTDRILE